MLGNLDLQKKSEAVLSTALKFAFSGRRYLTELKCSQAHKQGLVLQKMCEVQQALKL